MPRCTPDPTTRSLGMADGRTDRSVDENALRCACIRIEAPERALELATGRSGTDTNLPSPNTPGGAMGR